MPKCLFVIIVIYLYFIHISQRSVEAQLRCGENILIILLQIVCRVCQ